MRFFQNKLTSVNPYPILGLIKERQNGLQLQNIRRATRLNPMGAKSQFTVRIQPETDQERFARMAREAEEHLGVSQCKLR